MRDEIYRWHAANEEVHWWFSARRVVLEPIIASAMRDHHEDLIADIGCGTGGTVKALSGEYNCIGIDHSNQAIDLASAKYPDCTFVCGAASRVLAHDSQKIALFTLMDVLEHIEDDRGALEDVIALARPGAHVLITVPAAPILWSEHDEAAGHLRRYDHGSFAALWKGLPVRPKIVTPFNARLYPAIWLARVLGRQLGLFKGKGGADLAMPHPVINRVLCAIFAGEKARILRLITGDKDAAPYRYGVSFLALLECEGRSL